MTPFGRSGIAPFVAVGTGADAATPIPDDAQRQAGVKDRQEPFSFFSSLFIPPATFFPLEFFTQRTIDQIPTFSFSPVCFPFLSRYLNK
jgi:hypothetical protein